MFSLFTQKRWSAKVTGEVTERSACKNFHGSCLRLLGSLFYLRADGFEVGTKAKQARHRYTYKSFLAPTRISALWRPVTPGLHREVSGYECGGSSLQSPFSQISLVPKLCQSGHDWVAEKSIPWQYTAARDEDMFVLRYIAHRFYFQIPRL